MVIQRSNEVILRLKCGQLWMTAISPRDPNVMQFQQMVSELWDRTHKNGTFFECANNYTNMIRKIREHYLSLTLYEVQWSCTAKSDTITLSPNYMIPQELIAEEN